ncbi:MAG: hypothetical protein JWP46_1683, partial [Modestobacter sp.]|nr:hypothetical protein [Modestobacter sp.]
TTCCNKSPSSRWSRRTRSGGARLAARKADVLRTVQPPADMARDTMHARYTAGTSAGEVPLREYPAGPSGPAAA